MEQISVMRLLRLRHGISLREFAGAAGVSHQYISDLELGKYIGQYNFKKHGESLIQQAFEYIIAQKDGQARRLSEEYRNNRRRLLDFVTEDDYEL